jgi:hypothetical protein
VLGSNGTLEWVTVAKAVFELAEAESRATAKSQEEVTAQEVTAQLQLRMSLCDWCIEVAQMAEGHSCEGECGG